MAYYTTFYFRAKLNFDLPPAVADTLQRQCGPWDARHEDYLAWSEGEPAPAGYDWAGWERHPHPFFALPTAWFIPRSVCNGPATEPDFRRYADGGAYLSFTSDFQNSDQQIQGFLDWIAPYVRRRFGKRLRGRTRVWVGWIRPESAERNINVFITRDALTGASQVQIDYQYT